LQYFQEDLNTVPHEGYRDYKSELQEYTQEKFGCVPIYHVARERGPDHEKVFEIELVIRGQLRGLGAGKSKKEAEQDAARTVLNALTRTELQANPNGDPVSCPGRGLNLYPP
jgi:ribonuclease-3